MLNIAIIGGGGVGGISALAQLTERNIKANFTIYEKDKIAYSSSMLSKYSSHLCNTESQTNSLYNNKPDDFVDYLKSSKKRQMIIRSRHGTCLLTIYMIRLTMR